MTEFSAIGQPDPLKSNSQLTPDTKQGLGEATELLRRVLAQNSPLVAGVEPSVTYYRAEIFKAASQTLDAYDELKQRVKVLEEALKMVLPIITDRWRPLPPDSHEKKCMRKIREAIAEGDYSA